MTNNTSRRQFLHAVGTGIVSAALAPKLRSLAQPQPDYRLEISPLRLEIAPGKTIETTAYNGRVPGPLIRWPENKPIRIQVINRTDTPEIVHWHGLFTPSDMDGASEEGSPMITPGTTFLYEFTPRPAGFRWYHTHASAGHNLKRALYSGQFGCFYLESNSDRGAYDQELFLTLHDWNAHMGGGGDSSMDVVYDYATINDRMLGHGDPIRVAENHRLLVHLLNSSATLTHWIALSGHAMQVVAMDGNPVPRPASVSAVRVAPAERLDLAINMNRPGLWVMGETRKDLRAAGMGIVVEYANQSGTAKWIDPPETFWDYAQFADPPENRPPDVEIPLVFQSKFAGHGDFDHWTINGKSFPHTDTIPLQRGKRYRLTMTNRSADPHPIHLHRHTFEVTNLGGKPFSGLQKDVVLIDADATSTVDFTADNPGPTLFHCHQQNHMDFGFMTLFACGSAAQNSQNQPRQEIRTAQRLTR
jgi:FtsP/CotA-like multicopper oxidase with cupredoxin domain